MHKSVISALRQLGTENNQLKIGLDCIVGVFLKKKLKRKQNLICWHIPITEACERLEWEARLSSVRHSPQN